MKILNVIENIDEVTGGGVAERTRQLGSHLINLGHDITVLTINQNLSPSNIASLGPVKLISIPCMIKRFYIPLPFFRRINKAVKNADIVHLVSHWSILNVLTFVCLRINKKPYVITPLGALPIFGRSGLIKRIYNFMIGVNIIRKANICVVATLEELVALSSYGVNKKSVVHIPNGINEYDYPTEDLSNFSKEINVLKKHPFILYIGRLNSIKGPDLLIKAFCKVKDNFPDIHLVYIGPDEGMLDSLKKTALGAEMLERIHILGWVSKEQKAAILHASLFLTIPSRQEAMSIVVLESGIVGKPVLITDQCGFDEVELIGGGFVVPATIDGIAAGIKKLLDSKSDLRSMGLNLQKLVRNNFLWSTAAKKYASIFTKVIKNKI